MAIVTIDSKAFSHMLKAMLLAASTDETRAHLSCIRIETRGKDLRMVATDGHWLLAVDRTLEKDAILAADDVVHISREDATRLVKLLPRKGVVRVNLAGRVDDISGKQIGVFAVVDVTFPRYEQVIPECTHVDTARPPTYLGTDRLEAIAKAAALIADRKDTGLHIAYGATESDPCLGTFVSHDVAALFVIMPSRERHVDMGALVSRFTGRTAVDTFDPN